MELGISFVPSLTNRSMHNCPKLISNKFKRLSAEYRDSLMGSFSKVEIKDVVWCCGTNKELSPYKFTFKFLKRFLELIKNDILMFIKDSEGSGMLVRGCNFSFILLISKIRDPLTLKDYRLVNLVGYLYKVLSKVLAKHLKKSWIKLFVGAIDKCWREEYLG